MKILVIYALFIFQSFVQEKQLNEYGLYVVDNMSGYYKLVVQDSSKLLVNLQEYIPGLKIDVKYASDKNFLGEQVYPYAATFLRLPAAEALKQVQEELKKKNYELKIFDAYRPYSITVKMYITYEDTTYVASAWTGSRHNRGCAVDITIINSETGEEIIMPTGYDDFTEKAHPDYKYLPDDVINNRALLINTMSKFGFMVYTTEWWHYDFNGWENYELMDLNFEELEK
ncbi:MAG: M15 family metallopeptidase [Ignavibacteriaceae bacterium]